MGVCPVDNYPVYAFRAGVFGIYDANVSGIQSDVQYGQNGFLPAATHIHLFLSGTILFNFANNFICRNLVLYFYIFELTQVTCLRVYLLFDYGNTTNSRNC